MVPLATPARLATSSSRVAANPRAMNSSSAASTMASRRSAARSARLAGGFGAAAFAGGFGRGWLRRAAVLGRVLLMLQIMTDWSVMSILIERLNFTSA